MSYLVHAAVTEKPYTIFGYKGKQVRDQIHSFDVLTAFEHFANSPRAGEVYNLGGGKQNSASVLETIDMIASLCGYQLNWTLSEQNRIGDHICYYSDLRKLQSHYPNWELTYSLRQIVEEMVEAEEMRNSQATS